MTNHITCCLPCHVSSQHFFFHFTFSFFLLQNYTYIKISTRKIQSLNWKWKIFITKSSLIFYIPSLNCEVVKNIHYVLSCNLQSYIYIYTSSTLTTKNTTVQKCCIICIQTGKYFGRSLFYDCFLFYLLNFNLLFFFQSPNIDSVSPESHL